MDDLPQVLQSAIEFIVLNAKDTVWYSDAETLVGALQRLIERHEANYGIVTDQLPDSM